jgi:hypothetical protein
MPWPMVVKVGRSRHADYVLLQALQAVSRALRCLGRQPNAVSLASAAQLLHEIRQLQAAWSLLSRALSPDYHEAVQIRLGLLQQPLQMHLLADRVARWHGRRGTLAGQALPLTRQQLDALGESLQQESERWRRLHIDVMLSADDLQLVMLQVWRAGARAWGVPDLQKLQAESVMLHHQLDLYRQSLGPMLKSRWWCLRHLSDDAVLLLKLKQVDPEGRWRAGMTGQLSHRVEVLAQTVYGQLPAAFSRELRELFAHVPQA